MKYREVKRKAKVGEKILITNLIVAHVPKVLVGDTFKITDVDVNKVGTKEQNYFWDEHSEYVVLEPIEKFNWKEFKSSRKIAVHCKTEKEAKDFCRRMHKHGLKWRDGESYLECTMWEYEKENICYTSSGKYSRIGFYEGDDYTILEYSNYFKPSKKQILKDRIAELEGEVENLSEVNESIVKQIGELRRENANLKSKLAQIEEIANED